MSSNLASLAPTDGNVTTFILIKFAVDQKKQTQNTNTKTKTKTNTTWNRERDNNQRKKRKRKTVEERERRKSVDEGVRRLTSRVEWMLNQSK